MDFDVILPWIIILGYALTTGLGALGSRIRRASNVIDVGGAAGDGTESWDDASTTEPTPGFPPRSGNRLATTCTVAAWLTGIAVTVFWLYTAVGVDGMITIVLVLVVGPAVLTLVGSVIADVRERRTRSGARPMWPRLLLGSGGLTFLVIAANLFVNGTAHLLGLGYPSTLHVTANDDGAVSGTYEIAGTEHYADEVWWLGGPVPDSGGVVDVIVGPWWPYPIITSTLDAVLSLVAGTIATVPGVLLAIAAKRSRAGRNLATQVDASPPDRLAAAVYGRR